jgi:hypothetical protein
MKKLFSDIKSSFYDPAFYKAIKDKPPVESFKYFFSLIFLLALILAAVTSIAITPAANGLAKAAISIVRNSYPADLKLTIDKGMAATSVARPYKLRPPPELFDGAQIARLKSQSIENLIVIDTKSDFAGVKQFTAAKTLVLLTRDSYVGMGRGGGIQIYSFKSISPIVITKAYLEDKVARFLPLIKFIIPLLFIFAAIATFFIGSVFWLVVALVAGFIVWLINLSTKLGFPFRKVFQQTIHAATAVAAVDFLFDLLFILFGFRYGPFGAGILIPILITVLIWIANLKPMAEKESSQPPATNNQ